jgi:cyclophilin family peptidyl-prolyl cis-trans isomerase
MKRAFFIALFSSLLVADGLFGESVVRFSSNVGEIDMELFDTETPLTVANFLFYVNAGRYNQSFIHRSVPGFVIQGGGFGLNGSSVLPVTTNAAVQNEPGISNLRGTVAMAKLGDNPDSATSQWFINLEDNAENLDAQNGGFTVFGRVVGNGMAVADRIAAFATYNATAQLGGAFGNLPLQSADLKINNLILFSTVRALPAGTVLREFDFSGGDQGFASGFADLPASYDPALYNLVADHRNLPTELGGGKGLFISGVNRSDDLWMFWKKKLTGLQPSTEYQVVLDVEMASNVVAGMIGVGGAPGESVYVKAGVSQAEPLVEEDAQGQLRLTVDKGNQSTSGSAAAVLGNVAKENDDSEQYALLHRNNRSIQQSATTSADGSLWIFFGTDSGFESTTSLYYTHAAAVLMPKAKPSLTWSTPAAIACGTALGASQLNATANVAGNFTYTPSAGTVLPAGNHTLNVVFTPTDTGNYTTASANVTLKVNDAPAVSTPPPSVGAPPPSGGTSQPERTKKGKSSKKSSVSKSKSTTGSSAKKSGSKKPKKK